jgi:predicted DNA-binding transcriptional regulator YafY
MSACLWRKIAPGTIEIRVLRRSLLVNQIERLYKIEQLLATGRAVPTDAILARLEVSRATFKRDLDYLRDRLNAPIVWDRRAGGYRWERSERAGPRYQLPGLWFNSSEAYALLAMQQLLEQIEPGLLAGQVGPLMGRLRALIGAAQHDADEVGRRVRVVQSGARRGNARHFADRNRSFMQF